MNEQERAIAVAMGILLESAVAEHDEFVDLDGNEYVLDSTTTTPSGVTRIGLADYTVTATFVVERRKDDEEVGA